MLVLLNSFINMDISMICFYAIAKIRFYYVFHHLYPKIMSFCIIFQLFKVMKNNKNSYFCIKIEWTIECDIVFYHVMNIEYILIFLILAICVVYAGYRIYLALQGRSNPCAGCDGCELSKLRNGRKPRKHIKSGECDKKISKKFAQQK